MEELEFVFPSAAYEEKAAAFLREFREGGSAINGTGGLDRMLEQEGYPA